MATKSGMSTSSLMVNCLSKFAEGHSRPLGTFAEFMLMKLSI
jgi:hypothetical protein